MRRGGSRCVPWVLSPLLFACGANGPGGGDDDVIDRSVRVQVHVGAAVTAGVPVIAHHASGELVARADTDASGVATIPAGADDLISVLVPGDAQPISYLLTVVTTPVPASGQLDVRGPAWPSDAATPMAGTITIAAVAGLAAGDYDIHLGCTRTSVPSLPATLEVPAPCLGSDRNLDVLVEGFDLQPGDPPIPQRVGYFAGRVPLVAGHADLAAPAWQATPPTIPVAIDAGLRVDETWTLWADGLPFGGWGLGASAPLWSGLAVDGASLAAELDVGVNAPPSTLRRRIAGVPGAQHIGAADFLAAPPGPIVIDDRDRMALHWAADAGASAADVVHAALHWQGAGPEVRWNAVLRPGTTAVAFPHLPPDLAPRVSMPIAGRTVETDLRYLDSSELDGFDAAQAAGLDVTAVIATDAIVRDVTSGQLRMSHAIAND